MLSVNSLSFSVTDKPIFDALSFSLDEGELLHLKGANGAGKTTLLKLLAGLLPAPEKSISWQGETITKDLALYQKKLCYLGHKTGVSLALTVKENADFDLKIKAPPLELKTCLEAFGLSSFLETSCSKLSEGLRRRVSLLRLFLSKTKLWLLDEPFTALDASTQALLVQGLKEHLKAGGLIILSSHQALPEALHPYRVLAL